MTDADNTPPRQGDPTICLNCGDLLIFTVDLVPRRPTIREINELMDQPSTWETIEKLQFEIKRRGPIVHT